jgi:hypothetical protein
MSKSFFRWISTYKCRSELTGDHMVMKKRQLPINVKIVFGGSVTMRIGQWPYYSGERTAVTYKCQKHFFNGLVPINVKVKWLVKRNEKNHLWISDSQKSTRKLSQAYAVWWGCSISVTIGGRTRQLLCGGGIAAIRQWQIRPQECCEDVALYGGEKTAVTYKYQKQFLRRSIPISVKVIRLVIIWWWKNGSYL